MSSGGCALSLDAVATVEVHISKANTRYRRDVHEGCADGDADVCFTFGSAR